MTRCILTLAILSLAAAGCAGQSATLTPAETTAAQTVAGVAAAQNTTVAQIVAAGQLFCQTPTGIVAPAATTVIGKVSQDVANACKLVSGIPVAVAPAAAASVPVVVPAKPAS